MIRAARVVGFTASAFDLLHAGHVAMLAEARSLCDRLIVGLHIDPSLERPWKNQPAQTVVERYLQLAALSCVDEVIPYATEADLMDLLTTLPIDVRILGEEYRGTEFTGHALPIAVHYNKRRHRFSSSELRRRIFDADRDRADRSPESLQR